MTRHKVFLLFSASWLVLSAPAQTFDTSGNATLKGSYFVREILFAGQAADGSITSAASVIGTVTFDGKGNYSFTGQRMISRSGSATNLTSTGVYGVAANGLIQIGSIAQATDTAYGGLSALGPSGFVASATEGTNVDILVAIPAGTTATNATLKGAYSAGFIDFLNGDVTMVRQATFNATSDGAGGLGSVRVNGEAANLGGAVMQQTASSVSYSLTGTGSGTVNFGAASPSQLISGTKTFYISADQNIVLAGSPNGFDLLVGIRSLGVAANNATSSGSYFVAGLEDVTGGSARGGNSIDGFYGSVSATGAGASIFHNRLQSFAQPVYDYTFSSQYSVNTDGTGAPTDIPYQLTLGSGGRAFVATGTSGLYSLVIGLGVPQYSGTGVYISPIGIVNAANFAPITNPIAPGELVSLFGTGLASATAQASSLPLPTMLGGVQVTVNGQAAPLVYVSANQLAFLVPSAIAPANGIYYATIKVTNSGKASNAVTVYTANSAPAVFSRGSSGFGPAAAQLPNYSLITSTNPAKAGETVIVYLSGLGIVSPSVVDGTAAPSNPPSTVTTSPLVDFSGIGGSVVFAGLTPGGVGLYQINAGVPTGTGVGSVYLDISTPDAYASAATISIAGTSSNLSLLSNAKPPVARRGDGSGFSPFKSPGLEGRHIDGQHSGMPQ